MRTRLAPFTRFWLAWVSLSGFLLWLTFFTFPELLETDRYRLVRLVAFGSPVFAGTWFLIVSTLAAAALWRQKHLLIVAALSLHMMALFWFAMALIEKAVRDNVGGYEIAIWILSGTFVSGYVLARGQ